jgi:hypothetical protein
MERFRALVPFVRPPSPERARCEMCGVALDERHRHVFDGEEYAVRCACTPCAILFHDSGGRWRSVPVDVEVDPEFLPDEAEWVALGIPVGLAFVVIDSRVGRPVAFYPSPAGIVEAPVPEAAWQALGARTPLCRGMRPDVEALLVRRRRGGPVECFRAPLDLCYELGALVRRTWQGVGSGGPAEEAIDAFFAALAARARPISRGVR